MLDNISLYWFEWAGRLSGDQLPTRYNPPSGYITTSNEMNLPNDYFYKERKLSFEWEAPFRHQRIDEVLSKQNRVSIEDSMRLQNDVTAIPARMLLVLYWFESRLGRGPFHPLPLCGTK
jgi:penicillin amidase